MMSQVSVSISICDEDCLLLGEGKASRAYADFERAVDTANENTSSSNVVLALANYALGAISLGDAELGKSCYERALFVARQNQIAWRITYLCLVYAQILFKVGQYDAAYEFLLEALSHGTQTEAANHMFIEIGIPIALYRKDETLLAKCIRKVNLFTWYSLG